jgi:hypothetical protein
MVSLFQAPAPAEASHGLRFVCHFRHFFLFAFLSALRHTQQRRLSFDTPARNIIFSLSVIAHCSTPPGADERRRAASATFIFFILRHAAISPHYACFR